MATNLRVEGGRFAAGNPGGPGRPKRATEQKYLAAMANVATVEAWTEICQAAVEAAKAGDAKARAWLSQYLLPKPEEADIDAALEADARATELAALAESFGVVGVAGDDPEGASGGGDEDGK